MEKPAPCKYEIRHDGDKITLRVLCRECSQRELKDRNCFSSLIQAFAKEENITQITLSSHVETQYFGKALTLLKGITALSYEMRNFGQRQPHTESGETPTACSSCKFRPQDIFPEMNNAFLRDVGQFHSLFHDMTVRLYEVPEPKDITCVNCQLATREDFDYVYSRFEKLLREIVIDGYAVVV